MVHAKTKKIRHLGYFFAVAMITGTAIFPGIASTAANVTFSTDTAVVMTGPGINLTTQAGSIADTFTLNTSTIDLVIDMGNSVILIDSNKGQFNNNGGVNNCHLLNDQNIVTFTGPLTVTVTPSTVVCVPDSIGWGGGIISVIPKALPQYSKLDFIINSGSQAVTTNILGIIMNADPRYVSGYAISLDKNFVNASLIKYTPTTTLTLPQQYGTYTVYLKYYSITGNASEVISHTIEYQASKTAPKTPTIINALKQTNYFFKRNLSAGMTGADVKKLQKYLNANGFIVDKAGIGSPGKESNYFGLLTKKAVIKFQKANKITPAVGYVGPVTRKIINSK